MSALPAPTLRLPALLDDAAAPDLAIAGLALRSQDVTPGAVFLAVRGRVGHGLSWAADAQTRGAVAVLYEPDAAITLPALSIPLWPVADLGVRAAALAARYYDEPSRKLQVTGITGTDGKTSTAWILTGALHALGRRAHYIGTLGAGAPGALAAGEHTTPDPVAMQRALAAAVADAAQAVVVEASSHALDQARLAGTRLHAAVLTNVGRDHLDYHGNGEAYVAAKRRLFSDAEPQHRILNIDDPVGRRWAADWPQAWTYALNAPARVTAQDMRFTDTGLHVSLCVDGRAAALASPLLGRFNVANLLAAATVLLADGVPLADVAAALAQVGTVPGRMEAFHVAGGPLVIVDYAHTPQALGAALLAARTHTRRQLICVFGCGGNRDAGKRPLMGQTAVAVADRIILTDDNPRHESPGAIFAQILAGMGEGAAVRTCHDRAAAIDAALAEAGEGDVVLIAGKGHERVQLYGDQQRPYSDRDHVADRLGLERRP